MLAHLAQRTKHTKPWDQVDYNKLKSLEGVLWTGPQQGPSRMQRVKDYAIKVRAWERAKAVPRTQCGTALPGAYGPHAVLHRRHVASMRCAWMARCEPRAPAPWNPAALPFPW